MTKKSVGYPLPPGEAFTDELACMMIFIPDKDEYRQAFFSAFFYLSNWIAWENDPDKRGKDAARAWKLAVEATLECIEMDMCGTIVSLLTEIRDNTGIHCCDVVDISDGDRFTDVVEDGEGDVPQNIIDAGYATGVSDWVGYDEYKCMISHIMVNNMTAQLEQILSYMVPPSIILGGIPTLLAIVTTLFIDFLSALVYQIAVGAGLSAQLSVAIALLEQTGLEGLIEDMAEHHDALACAIYNADGIDGAVIALRDEIDALFTAPRAKVLLNLNLDAQLKTLYAGRYDAQDIAQKLADEGFDVDDYDCTCAPGEESYLAVFATDEEEYDVFPTDSLWHVTGNPSGSINMHWQNGWINIRVAQIQQGAGVSLGDDIEVTHVALDYMMPNPASPDSVKIIFDETDTDIEMVEGPVVEDVWTQLDFHPATPLFIAYNVPALKIRLDGGSGSSGFVDNIRIWFNTV